MESAKVKATYADLVARPDDRAEVIDGVIETSPSPTPEHGRAQRTIARYVGGPFDDDDGRGGPGGWWILTEMDVQLTEHDVVRPDLTGWKRERLPDPWGQRPIDVVPDWVCEVLSPSNASHDRVTKRRLYAAHRVPYYWLVDPVARTLEALGLEGDRWVELGVFGDGDLAQIPPFDAIELEVARFFPPPARDE